MMRMMLIINVCYKRKSMIENRTTMPTTKTNTTTTDEDVHPQLNEYSQQEVINDVKWILYWLHCTVNGGKSLFLFKVSP